MIESCKTANMYENNHCVFVKKSNDVIDQALYLPDMALVDLSSLSDSKITTLSETF